MNKFSAYNIARSFACAFQGILRSLWHERNLRIHFFMAAYVLYFSGYFALTNAERAVLFLTIGFVVACEMVNTAIETAIDLSTPVYNDLAKMAKDAAAGAVLISAGVSVAVGITLFGKPATLLVIWTEITAAPFVWLFLVAITIFLISWPERRQNANGSYKNNRFKERK